MIGANLTQSADLRDFYVWVDPSNVMAMHNARLIGHVSSVNVSQSAKLLPLMPNPDFRDVPISPFSLGLIRPYLAEYHLETARAARFQSYPSRLSAMYLLGSKEDAEKYRDYNMSHVGNRELMRVATIGNYLVSEHDSSWIEFLRLGHSLDDETIHQVANAYWAGASVESCELSSMGKSWTRPPLREFLFEGAVNFPQ